MGQNSGTLSYEDIERDETRGEHLRELDEGCKPLERDIHEAFLPTPATPGQLEAAGQQRLDLPRPKDYCLRCGGYDGVSYLMGRFNCDTCQGGS